MHSPCRKPRRWLTHNEKGKKKMSDYGTDREESDRRESNSEKRDAGPSRAKFALTKKALTLANEHLRRYNRQKNPVVQFEYNKYMVHHYAYMTHVAEVGEEKSYTKAVKGTNWRASMEEEMRALAENETWNLGDVPKDVKPIRCRWLYKVKYNTDRSVNRYKARLVAKGYA